ncbi:MAG TPA: DUF502 domain-containing protein [Phenylobacterium sp.]|nr:DUF502 domain-containing protein [Phenylobacterium sp.]
MDPQVRQFLVRWPQTLAVGAITLAPLALTVWALWLLAKLAALLGSLVIRPIGAWFGAGPPGALTTVLEIITAVLILTVVGVLARGAAGKAVGRAVDDFIGRIPIGRTVYSSAQKLIASFQSPMEQAQKVVLIEFPSEEMKTVGLVTQIFTAADSGEELAAVYVPTTPNPTSGYLVLVPAMDVIRLEMSVEDGIKLVISGGIVVLDTLPGRQASQAAAGTQPVPRPRNAP